MVHMDRPALLKRWVLNAQWTDIPKDVYDQVVALWGYQELGNDNYILIRSINDLIELEDQKFEAEVWVNNKWEKAPLKTDLLVSYLREQGVPDDEDVYIYWWW